MNEDRETTQGIRLYELCEVLIELLCIGRSEPFWDGYSVGEE